MIIVEMITKAAPNKVFIVKKEVEEIPDEPPKTYSLYGEDY